MPDRSPLPRDDRFSSSAPTTTTTGEVPPTASLQRRGSPATLPSQFVHLPPDCGTAGGAVLWSAPPTSLQTTGRGDPAVSGLRTAAASVLLFPLRPSSNRNMALRCSAPLCAVRLVRTCVFGAAHFLCCSYFPALQSFCSSIGIGAQKVQFTPGSCAWLALQKREVVVSPVEAQFSRENVCSSLLSSMWYRKELSGKRIQCTTIFLAVQKHVENK